MAMSNNRDASGFVKHGRQNAHIQDVFSQSHIETMDTKRHLMLGIIIHEHYHLVI